MSSQWHPITMEHKKFSLKYDAFQFLQRIASLARALYERRLKTEKAHQEKRGYPNRGEGGRGHREPDLYQFRKRSVVWKTYPFFYHSFYLFLQHEGIGLNAQLKKYIPLQY